MPIAKDDNRHIDNTDGRIKDDLRIDNVDKKEEDIEDEDLCLERIRLAERSRAKESKKSFGGKFREKLFSSRGHLPKKSINRAKKVERYVNSLSINEFDINRSVTPLFEHEDLLNEEDFLEKRKEMLKNKKKNCFECEEIIILDSGKSTPIPDQNLTESFIETNDNLNDINMSCDQILDDDENICDPDKKSNFTLKVSENGSNSTLKGKETLISPEGYEEYLDGEIEEDYPELKSISSSLKSEEKICLNGSDSNENTLSGNSKTLQNHEVQIHTSDKELMNNEDTQTSADCGTIFLEENVKEKLDIGKKDPNLNLTPEVKNNSSEEPLSGSSSMSFMDETTPTSLDENYDFYQTATKAAMKAESMCNKCRAEKKKSRSFSTETNNTSFESTDNYFNYSLDLSLHCPYDSKFRQDSCHSLGNETIICRKNSDSISSMSMSSNSVASDNSTVKPKSMLFIPTNTSSLPEISLEPPTPLAPKPRENYDAERNIVYDLRVPGYSSMFLTVPGFDVCDEDRYLPGRTHEPVPDSNLSSDSSSSDDELVHKPRVFASLIGLAEKRGLKSYGSSCDLSKFGLSSPSDKEEDPDLKNNNEINSNFPVLKLSPKVSKIGGTKSGSFVAKKLAVFEKVVREERKKYLESHEARMRKQYSGEFNTKVLQPQNPDVLRVQEKDYISYCDARENNNPYLEYRRSSSPFIFRDDGNNSSFLNLSSNKNENLNMKTDRCYSVDSIGKIKRQNEVSLLIKII